MKDKEEKNLQFVLRYYRHGKLDTTKALNKITSHSQQNNLHRLWIFSSGIAAAILICIVSYTLLSRSDNNMISVTADAGITCRTAHLPYYPKVPHWNTTPIITERNHEK